MQISIQDRFLIITSPRCRSRRPDSLDATDASDKRSTPLARLVAAAGIAGVEAPFFFSSSCSCEGAEGRMRKYENSKRGDGKGWRVVGQPSAGGRLRPPRHHLQAMRPGPLLILLPFPPCWWRVRSYAIYNCGSREL